MDRSPGGVGDGLPALPTGEPVLARWFVLMMLVLVPIGFGVTVWAFASIEGTEISAAARRPPGTTTFTHDRGVAVLNETREVEPAPSCAEGLDLIGDRGARATVFRAVDATCPLLLRPEYELAAVGLERLRRNGGHFRVAVFELTGVDASTRVEDGEWVVELNAKFQFDDAVRATPMVIAELAHIGAGWPEQAVTSGQMLAALRLQDRACRDLRYRGETPRGCLDAAEVLAAEDPLLALEEAGFPPGLEP